MFSQEQIALIEAERKKIEEIKADIALRMEQAYDVLKDEILFDAEISVLRNGTYTFNIKDYEKRFIELLSLTGENVGIVLYILAPDIGFDSNAKYEVVAGLCSHGEYGRVVEEQYDIASWYKRIKSYLRRNNFHEVRVFNFDSIIYEKYENDDKGAEFYGKWNEPEKPILSKEKNTENENIEASPYLILFFGFVVILIVFLIYMLIRG